MPAALSARANYGLPRDAARAAPLSPAVTAVQTWAEIAAIAREWSELEQQSGVASFFQSPAWSLLAHRTFREIYRDKFKPLIMTVRRGRKLIAVAPLRIVRVGPVRLAIDLTDPFGQYGGMLIADDADRNAIVANVLATLRSATGIDGLSLRRVRVDSHAYPALLQHGFATGAPDAAPFVDLRLYPDFAAYHHTLNAKSRKNLRNLRNRLARIAPVHHRVATGDDVWQVIDQSFEGRLHWLDEHGIPSMAFGHPAFSAMLAGIRGFADRNELSLLAMGLYCGDDPVSLQWGFIHRGRYYAYIAARNPAFDDFSPGRLHLEDVIRTCFERNIQICDFLAPAARYKLTWTETATDVTDVAVPFTLAGRLWLDAWSRRLRPALKNHYAQLPLWLRRRIRRIASQASP
jgi:CelD/BcsL family acetyltransferase involved in cellulose biosynthesis